jgi:hypothetical protein
MATVNVDLPADLVSVAKLDQGNVSQEAAKFIALELFREGTVSIGRAAELCATRWPRLWTSPLITLAKIGYLDLLPQLYETVTITPEIYTEVVVSGAGLAALPSALCYDAGRSGYTCFKRI